MDSISEVKKRAKEIIRSDRRMVLLVSFAIMFPKVMMGWSIAALYFIFRSSGNIVIGIQGIQMLLVISIIARALLSNTAEVALTCYCLPGNTYSMEDCMRIAFDRSRYFRTAKIMLIRDIYCILFSFLLIIPGIYKTYQLKAVPVMIAKDGFRTINDYNIFDISSDCMKGHKMNAFALDLTFIGWDLLASLTFYVTGLIFSFPYKISAGMLYAIKCSEIFTDASDRPHSNLYNFLAGMPSKIAGVKEKTNKGA